MFRFCLITVVLVAIALSVLPSVAAPLSTDLALLPQATRQPLQLFQEQATTTPDDLTGMTTAWLTKRGQQVAQLTFPANAATAQAIRRMAAGQVSAVPYHCAATMREAMGFGLGDAHQWMKLADCGFMMRPKGTPAQPGDIMVWPFTFGRRGSQHIGVAVGTASGVRLLSNMTGGVALTAVVPGYAAFYKPTESAPAPTLTPQPTPNLRPDDNAIAETPPARELAPAPRGPG